jgi:flagellar biosynthesis protein FlhF
LVIGHWTLVILSMKTTSFIAASPADALKQVRAQLGPQAMVLNVRRLPAAGLSKLWQKPRIEVLAGVVEAAPAEQPPLTGLLQRIAQLNQQLPPLSEQDRGRIESLFPVAQGSTPAVSPASKPAERGSFPRAQGFQASAGLETCATAQGESKRATPAESLLREGKEQPPVHQVLEAIGLLPAYARSLCQRLHAPRYQASHSSLEAQLALAREMLARFWKEPAWRSSAASPQTHLFVGAPGVGKTTCLSKWLAQAVLLGGRSARVWRLDGRTANTAESLSVHAEILGVPVFRSWSKEPNPSAAGISFIDWPGVDCQDRDALDELAQRLGEMGSPLVHLVLNAAYDTRLLLEQIRAFSSLPIADLVFTHLDEEPRSGKLWNFPLSTNHPIGYLSAGQNVPGNFREASPSLLWPEEVGLVSDSSRNPAAMPCLS